MTERERNIRRRLKSDLAHYAGRCLWIRTKADGLAPMVLNRAQTYLHGCLEDQRRTTGCVRALVLKGRQQGCSTYVAARFFWKVTHRRGARALVMAHEMEASRGLLDMARRFYEHCPEAVRPVCGKDNAREIDFPALDSGYRVATAGARGAGRSQTVQFLHGSEVAFWRDAAEHAAGMLQTVPDAPGTEVILESTANGMGDFFHCEWQRAEAGESPFRPVFIPWFWQEEYRREPGPDFAPTPDECEYMRLHGLDVAQVAWRRNKIAELRDPELFRREYPATAAEAFSFTGIDPFIAPEAVMLARKACAEPCGPVVCGVDPARFGADATGVMFRQGRRAFGARRLVRRDTMQVAGECVRILEGGEPYVVRMFVDAGGLGAGVVDRLREMGFGQRITAVNFGSAASRPDRYANRRAEMWALMRDWLLEPTQADIPDDDALHADLVAPSYSYDSSGRLILESKDDMRGRGLRSPDLADALALTFALPVRGLHARQEFAEGGGMRRGDGFGPRSR
ncbi:hypothetical protein GGQ74_002195 [Desulfobaculum xiamenense]|uniref:Terminase-like family protein n=1 Tax=Desulfobaculum xiamenense TaxID=995050 RepID=A0A846QPU5_9BACT|nr:hypothetical protein [Desulfobaculum xiamenense]NJB68522.1 hypothetical protein [Desulfobaculum xiamenense]